MTSASTTPEQVQPLRRVPIYALLTANAFRRLRPLAGWLLLPYLLWLCLAVSLNYETGRLNPGADKAPLGLIGAS